MVLKLRGKDGFYGWVNMAVMFFFNVAVMLIMMSFGVFLPFWVEEFAWNRGVLTGANTLMMILPGIAAPMVGFYLMKQGAKRAILIGNIINVCGLVLLAYQNQIWQLYLGFGALVGIGLSFGGMLAMMTVINNWFVLKRPLALSISMASMGFSGLIVSPSMMALINAVGWRNTYLILGAVAFVFCVISPAIFIKNKPEDIGQVPDGPSSPKPKKAKPVGSPPPKVYKTPVDFTAKEALRTPTMWLLVGFAVVQFAVMQVIVLHNYAFLLDIGFPGVQAALAAGILGPVMSTFQLIVGFLALKYKIHSLAMISILLAIVGFTIMIFTQSLGVAIFYNIILGMGFGIQFIAMGNLIPDYFGRTEFPKMMGFTMPFSMISGALFAPVAGYIHDATESYMLAFQLSIAMLVLGFIFLILVRRPPVHPSLKTTS